ncbi:MAG: hypothetical protein JSV54_06865 [Chloroflexota bacterium]|nr:MAG: hypothetical protein JSV54_06865 [Chloroflexota bacterium]
MEAPGFKARNRRASADCVNRRETSCGSADGIKLRASSLLAEKEVKLARISLTLGNSNNSMLVWFTQATPGYKSITKQPNLKMETCGNPSLVKVGKQC